MLLSLLLDLPWITEMAQLLTWAIKPEYNSTWPSWRTTSTNHVTILENHLHKLSSDLYMHTMAIHADKQSTRTDK